MNEVGGAINRVDDPSGIFRQNTGSTSCYRLLTYEANITEITQEGLVIITIIAGWCCRFWHVKTDLKKKQQINKGFRIFNCTTDFRVFIFVYMAHPVSMQYLWVGYFSLMEDIINCSTFWSVSVTRSTGELFSMMLMSFWSASRIIWQKKM